MFILATALAVGCATRGDLQKFQSQQMLTNSKADQAVQDAQPAKAAADAATLKAEAATTRAENAMMMAEEKAKKADTVFQKSMKKLIERKWRGFEALPLPFLLATFIKGVSMKE